MFNLSEEEKRKIIVSKKYPELEDNEWRKPVMKNFGFACCDCGLVHRLDFKVIRWGRGHKILMRARRDQRATGQVRRHMKDGIKIQ